MQYCNAKLGGKMKALKCSDLNGNSCEYIAKGKNKVKVKVKMKKHIEENHSDKLRFMRNLEKREIERIMNLMLA